jgi:hypothetical protein
VSSRHGYRSGYRVRQLISLPDVSAASSDGFTVPVTHRPCHDADVERLRLNQIANLYGRCPRPHHGLDLPPSTALIPAPP